MRVLAIDPGERRIGLALSDPSGTLASPFGALRRKGLKEDLEAIARVVQEHDVALVLVGLPISLSGELGPQAQEAQAFAQELTGQLTVPVQLVDERLSTVAADRALLEAGLRREERRARRDAAAAAVFLQTYLDRAKREGGP